MKRINSPGVLSLLGFCVALLVGSSVSQAGFEVGNGGDYVRGSFLKLGNQVIDFLDNTAEGRLLVATSNIDLLILKSTLDAEKIRVEIGELRDWRGSLADATGTPGLITLQADAWTRHFETERDIYFLVLHEMLRSAGVDDNSYVISQAINPFPASLKVATRINPVVPVIAEDSIAGILDTARVTIGGSGCPQGALQAAAVTDLERNTVDVEFSGYVTQADSGRMLDRKACQMVLPVTLPAGKKLVITQLDLMGRLELESSATATIQFEAFLAGASSPVQKRAYTGALSGRTLIRANDVLETGCGQSTNLRINTSIVNQSAGAVGASIAGVDRATVYLRLENCIN